MVANTWGIYYWKKWSQNHVYLAQLLRRHTPGYLDPDRRIVHVDQETQGRGGKVLPLSSDQSFAELLEDAGDHGDEDDLIVIPVEVVKHWNRDD